MDASRFTSRRAVRFELALAAAMALGASGASSALAADHFCTTTAQFQTALTNASLTTNDTITLQASASFVAPSGGFVLPNKTGTGWITIRSQNLASLPADGTRVDMGDAANMPNILPNNFSESAIVAATSAHHFKLVGLEVIGVQNGTTLSTGDLIRLGVSGTAQDTLTEQPGNFEIDRCIVRAASDTHRIKRGVALNSSSTNITDSYFSGFKDPSSDTQAICGWNGSGPYNITNNYLEAACENIMFGGAVPSIPNLVPSNIVITKNHFFKPISWNQHQPGTYGGNNWSIKNLFEIKNGANITLEGNIFENHWVDSQSGWSIVLTPATSPGVAPWTVVENVTFRNNIIRNISAGPNILARDADGDVSEQTNNILFENNLIYNVGGSAWGGNGKMFQILGGTDEVTINHNTIFNASTFVAFDGTVDNTNFSFINNIVNRENPYGIHGSGSGEGNDALGDYCISPLVTANVIKSGSASLYNQHPGNFFPADWNFMVNKTGGNYENGDWDIDPGHAYQTAGTDGQPLGADIDEIVTATAGCISGVWGSTPTTVTLKNGVNGYNGAISLHVSGGSPTTHFNAARYHHTVNGHSITGIYGYRGFYKFNVSSIPSGSTVTSATLRIKYTYSGFTTNPAVNLHRVAPVGGFTVNYANATRNTYNGTNSWTGGANGGGNIADSNNDFLDTADDIENVVGGGAGGTLVFNVTPSVQAWVNGTANNGWLVFMNHTSSIVYLGTTADLSGSVDYPELEITYQ